MSKGTHPTLLTHSCPSCCSRQRRGRQPLSLQNRQKMHLQKLDLFSHHSCGTALSTSNNSISVRFCALIFKPPPLPTCWVNGGVGPACHLSYQTMMFFGGWCICCYASKYDVLPWVMHLSLANKNDALPPGWRICLERGVGWWRGLMTLVITCKQKWYFPVGDVFVTCCKQI